MYCLLYGYKGLTPCGLRFEKNERKEEGFLLLLLDKNISRSPGEKVKPTVQITEKYYSNIWIESRTRDEGVEGAGRNIFYPTLFVVIY
jgi:hypothetical protein